jgi:hypothetical protein
MRYRCQISYRKAQLSDGTRNGEERIGRCSGVWRADEGPLTTNVVFDLGSLVVVQLLK